MAKRQRDTELWGKEWYVSLSCAERCAIDYILCRCDPVGVWAPAYSVAERLIGEMIDWVALPGKVNGNIEILSDGKWWLRDFCAYQYGKLHREADKGVQKSIVAILLRHGLWERYLETIPESGPDSGLTQVLSHKEKEKEFLIFEFSSRAWKGVTAEHCAEWKKAYPACDIARELEAMKQWLLANPEKRKQNYRRFITNWLARSQEKGGGRPSRKPGDGIDRSPAKHPLCDFPGCGRECVRGLPYWECPEHGKRENVG